MGNGYWFTVYRVDEKKKATIPFCDIFQFTTLETHASVT